MSLFKLLIAGSIAQQIERYRDNACEDYNKYFCQFQFQASNNYAMYSKHNVPILKGNNLYTEAVGKFSFLLPFVNYN